MHKHITGWINALLSTHCGRRCGEHSRGNGREWWLRCHPQRWWWRLFSFRGETLRVKEPTCSDGRIKASKSQWDERIKTKIKRPLRSAKSRQSVAGSVSHQMAAYKLTDWLTGWLGWLNFYHYSQCLFRSCCNDNLPANTRSLQKIQLVIES